MALKGFGSAVLLLLTFTGLKAIEPAPRGKLPLFLVKNAGQWNSGIDLAAQTGEMTVQFREREVEYRFPEQTNGLRIRYATGRPVHAEGLEELDSRINFMVGSDRRRWRDDVGAFSSAVYRGMWPGIDVLYSVSGDRLKTEFQLDPGANPDSVRWTVEGADEVKIARDGSLVMTMGWRDVREAAPQVFEQDRVTGALHPVTAAFRLVSDRTLGIQVGNYDRANRLIFDPVIGYSTYLGGSGQSAATAVAIDSLGNTVVAGYTTSLDLAVTPVTFGTSQRTVAYVGKIAPSGNKLIFCTYIGGTLDDRAYALALDRFNDIFIAGATTSRDFPLLRAVQPQINGAQNAFVTELNAAGSALVFSTYLGGSGADQAYGIGLNRLNNIFVTGDTTSANFPTVRPLQGAKAGGVDAFLAELGISGSKLLYSSYLGGTGDEHAAALAVDQTGAVSITGSTLSNNFPVSGPLQGASGGNQDAFITKINAACTAFVFSTYFGGEGGTVGLPEQGSGIAVDGPGNIYVTGTTSSNLFPVSSGAFQTTLSGGLLDAFALKLNATGGLIYSTYLGGSSADYGNAIAVDVAGNAHITGYTASPDFPSLNAFPSGPRGNYDIFLTKLNSTGTGLIYSAVMGGSQNDTASAVVVDRFGTVAIVGQTQSTDLPTQSAYQSSLLGAGSSVVLRIPVGWVPVTFGPASGNSVVWSSDAPLNSGATVNYSFGQSGDIPITGDWAGTGHRQIGVFRSGVWYLDSNGDGVYDAGDRSFTFGQAGDIPVLGDWNGTGRIKAGLFRNGTFILDLSGHMSGVATGTGDQTIVFGQTGDVPVAADWNRSGSTKIGVFRNGTWYLDWSGTHAVSGPAIVFGQAGDQPLVGDWDGSGAWKIGVYRQGTYYLDYNGDLAYSPVNDVTLTFGGSAPSGLMLQ